MAVEDDLAAAAVVGSWHRRPLEILSPEAARTPIQLGIPSAGVVGNPVDAELGILSAASSSHRCHWAQIGAAAAVVVEIVDSVAAGIGDFVAGIVDSAETGG